MNEYIGYYYHESIPDYLTLYICFASNCLRSDLKVFYIPYYLKVR